MKKIIAAGAMAAGLILAASPAAAQPDPSLAPNFGTLTLQGGFSNDPRVVSVTSGGSNAASDVSSRCRGFISDAPDVKLHYEAGSLPLIISVASSADTTLVINGPDGRWYCDDDGGRNGNNPALRWNNPQSGRYDIWVGSYRSGTNSRARLHVSEVSSQ